MKKQEVAIFDIDGVLADFEGAFCEAFGNKNRHLYDLRERYMDVDPELIMEWVNDEENYKNLNPIFGGITLLNQVKSKGFQVDLLTSRPKALRNTTGAWLNLYNLGNSAGHVDTGYTKAEFIKYTGVWDKYYDIQLFVDDNPKELKRFKELFPKTVCLAWAQPWNIGYFPRANYNQETMQIVVNMGDNVWKPIWSKK